ncbi:MAG TPA: hypothetical protein VMY76_12785 [Gemmatimonadales bacterium]|nr:hypothetical protein [Gemmatimonadales bacterium]
MRVPNVLHAVCVLALGGLAACGDQPATEPSDAGAPAFEKKASEGEVTRVGHPMLTRINARLAAARSNVRIDRAEIRYEAKGYDAQTSTVIVANDRTHLTSSQWVPGDPRRDGRIGVTYAVDPELQTLLTGLGFPVPVIETGEDFRLSSQTELDGLIEEAMQAWRDRRCSDAPIERVAVPAGTDPDLLDDVFLGRPSPSPTYAQVADIIQAGWQPAEFFEAFTPGGSEAILGITFTFVFVEDQGTPDESDDVPTDLDGNGRADKSLAEIYYNPTFIWTTRGAPNTVDFYSIITHETGHALGLAHFGKVFITKKDAVDGLEIADVKYAPKSLMNAVYFTGRDEITGTDNGAFCQIWARR